jgi:GTPase SAR1 family protein
MRKYGKKNIVKINPLDYNIGLFGQSGIGKSKIAVEICEQLVGENGYLLLNIGKEEGVDAIQGVVYEDVKDWKTFNDIVKDITVNKNTEYADLKVIIIDTIDELEIIGKKEVIRLHNELNPTKKTKTFNAAFGGFAAPREKLSEIILDNIWKLKDVGINVFVIGHVKRRTKNDVITGEEYDEVTAKISSGLFEDIKTKLHILGLGTVRRDVEKAVTGQDIMGKNITINKTLGAQRVITFRDDSFTIDAKSRFSKIVDRIPFNADDFIKAIKDAIEAEYTSKNVGLSMKEAETLQAKEKEEKISKCIENIQKADEAGSPSEMVDKIQKAFNEDVEKKDLIIEAMKNINCKNFVALKEESMENIMKVYSVI